MADQSERTKGKIYPRVEKILAKRFRNREGRKEVEYRVSYVGASTKKEWVVGRRLRKLVENAELMQRFDREGSKERHTEEEEAAPFQALTQEPTALDSLLLNGRASREATQQRRVVQRGDGGHTSPLQGKSTRVQSSRQNEPQLTASTSQGIGAQQFNGVPGQSEATPDTLQLSGAQFDDAHELFPPMAPLPGHPQYKSVLGQWPGKPHPPLARKDPTNHSEQGATLSLNPLLAASSPARQVLRCQPAPSRAPTSAAPAETSTLPSRPRLPSHRGAPSSSILLQRREVSQTSQEDTEGYQPSSAIDLEITTTSSGLGTTHAAQDVARHGSEEKTNAQNNAEGNDDSEAERLSPLRTRSKAAKQVEDEELEDTYIPPKTRSKTTQKVRANRQRIQSSSELDTARESQDQFTYAPVLAFRKTKTTKNKRRLSTGTRLHHSVDLLLAAAASAEMTGLGLKTPAKAPATPKPAPAGDPRALTPQGIPSLSWSPRRGVKRRRTPPSFKDTLLRPPQGKGSSVPAAIPLACQAAQATPQQPVIIISPAAQQRSPEAPVHSKASHLRSRGHNPGSPAHPQAPAQQERQQPPPLNPTRAQSGNPAVETAGSGSRSRSNVVQSSNAPEKGRAAGPQAGAAGWPPGQGGAPAMLGKEGSGLSALVFALQSEMSKQKHAQRPVPNNARSLHPPARDSSVEVISDSSASEDEAMSTGTCTPSQPDPAWNAIEGFFAKQIGRAEPQQVQTANSGSTERAAAATAREQPAAHPISRTPSVGPGDTEDLATKDMSNRETSGATSSREVSQSTALPKKAAALPVLLIGAEQAGSDALDRLSKQQWDQAEVIGARVREQGVQLHIKWQDGYSSWLLTASLKPHQHCLLKMVDYYESRVKGVARKK